MSSLSIAIGVLTYQRPRLLESLLPELLGQLEGIRPDINGEIIVVDNDPAMSAEHVVLLRTPRIRYVHEPIPGIAAARQRCVDEATGHDLLQFIDDDEEPVGDWLKTMIEAWQTNGKPTAVAGRVIPRYAVPPGDWIIAGGFFDRRRYPTGTVLPAAPSGNLLLDLNQVRQSGTKFDRSLGLGGGEDTLFTLSLVDAGGRIVFCDDAAVLDLVPADRSTRDWVLQRARHHGSTSASLRIRRALPRQSLKTRAVLVLGGCARAVIGEAKALVGSVTGNKRMNARGLRLLHRGRGMVTGAVGISRPEYERQEVKTV